MNIQDARKIVKERLDTAKDESVFAVEAFSKTRAEGFIAGYQEGAREAAKIAYEQAEFTEPMTRWSCSKHISDLILKLLDEVKP